MSEGPSRRTKLEEPGTGRGEPAPSRAKARWNSAGWIGVACGAVAFLAFLPALGAELVNFDDDWNIAFNPRFQGLSGKHLEWIFTTSSPMGHYQPLTWLSYAVDFALFGHRAEAYHRTNVLLHAAAAAAFFGLALTLLREVRGDGSRPGTRSEGRTWLPAASALSALLFSVHPLRVESVAWATGRNDLLSGLFAVLATTAWVRYGATAPCVRWTSRGAASAVGLAAAALGLALAGIDLSTPRTLRLRTLAGAPWGGAALFLAAVAFVALVLAVLRARGVRRPAGKPLAYAAASLCLLLSFASKPWAVGLPAVLLALDLWPLRRHLRRDPATAPPPLRAALCDLVLEKLPLLVLCSLSAVLARWAKASLPILVKTWEEHTLAERIVQAFYGLAFYPLKTLWPSRLVVVYDLPDVLGPRDPRFLLPILAVTGLALVLVLLRRKAPAAAIAGLAYAVLVAPALGFVQFNTLLVADRYSYVACMPFALLAGGAWLRACERFPRWRAAALGASLVASGAFFASTWRQCAVWRTSESLYLHALESTASPRVLSNLALVYNEKAFRDPARRGELLEEALALSTRAMRLAREAGLFEPQYHLTHGTVLLNRGDLEGAIAELRAFDRAKPDHAQGSINLGLALVRAGRFHEALPVLRRAVVIAEDSAEAWRILGLACEGAGDRSGARAAYRRSARIDPGHPVTRARLRDLEGGG